VLMAIAVTVPLTVATSGVYFELLSHSNDRNHRPMRPLW
jgi:hypothetical protein